MNRKFQYGDELVLISRRGNLMKVNFHSYMDEMIVNRLQIAEHRMSGLPNFSDHINDCWICRFDKKFTTSEIPHNEVDVYAVNSTVLFFDLKRKVLVEEIPSLYQMLNKLRAQLKDQLEVPD